MSDINFLPWRETLREQRKRTFFVALLMMAAIASLLLLLIAHLLQDAIKRQDQHNMYLNEQISLVEARLYEVRKLRQQQQTMLGRVKVVQDLQWNRSVIVHLLDELVRSVPEGIYLDEVSRADDVVRLRGLAASNNLVSELMRRLDASDWFSEPRFQKVAVNDEMPSREAGYKRFHLRMMIERKER